MQRFLEWFQGVLLRPRATAALIGSLAGLAFVTTALAYAVGGPPASAAPGSVTPTPQTANVAVALYDNRVESSRATFTPGTRYQFTVVNRGSINHELMLMPRGMGGMPMAQMERFAIVRTGDLAPGATKTLDYTFAAAMARQHLEFGCYYPGHYESGMHMPITISR